MRSVKGSVWLASQMLRYYLQENFLQRYHIPQRNGDYVMGGDKQETSAHFYLARGRSRRIEDLSEHAMELCWAIPLCARGITEFTARVPERLLRDDDISLETADSQISSRFNNSFFCLDDGEIVQIVNIIIADIVKKAGIFCVVKKITSRPLNTLRLPDASLPIFFRQCNNQFQLTILPADDLRRPVVVVLANNEQEINFAIIPPSIHSIM